MKLRIIIKAILILIISGFSFVPFGFAGDGSNIYWVHPTGSASWATCESDTDPGSNYCSLSTARSSVTAGDTVYLKEGSSDYTVGLTLSSKTGTENSKITFAAASGETPVIQPTSGTGLQLLGMYDCSWIVIDGITFKHHTNLNSSYLLYIYNASNHIEIDSCIFDGQGNADSHASIRYGTSGNTESLKVTHIWIHDSTFANIGDHNNNCSDDNGLQIGLDNQLPVKDGYMTFEDNVFYGGGHHNFESYGVRMVLRNNVFHNEATDSGSCSCPGTARTARLGKFGNRNMQMLGCGSDAYECDTWNVIEGNRSGFAEEASDGSQEGNFTISGPRMIIRYNKSYYSETNAFYFKYVAEENCLYNNTSYYDGKDSNGSCNNSDWNNTIVEACGGTTDCQYNNVINNLFAYPADDRGTKNSPVHHQNFAQNFCTFTDSPTPEYNYDGCVVEEGDPAFDDTDLSDPRSLTHPGLNLTESSEAIDIGSGGNYGRLTQANGSGSNSTTLVVDNSNYFQCGSDCATTPVGADISNIQADWIAIGTVSNVVQISDINHSTNTITLASPMTWSDNANIWLYKKSDGQRVLYGSAPDYGAHEFSISPPQNLRIVQQ